MDNILWILVSFGITFSMTHGKIFKSLREKVADTHHLLGDIISCPMCLGFWVGIFLSLTWESPTGSFFLDGFLSLTTCWLLFCISWWLALKDPRV